MSIQGNDMDSSRGVLSGTMDKFKMVMYFILHDLVFIYLLIYMLLVLSLFHYSLQVFETKSSRRMFTLVASFVVLFLVVYYLTR